MWSKSKYHLPKHQHRQGKNVVTVALATHVNSVHHMRRFVGFVGKQTTSKLCEGVTMAEGAQCMT